MNYELAKKLKDAGFPQTGDLSGMVGIYYPNEEETWSTIFYNQYVTLKIEGHPEILYLPTLSELIEACGGMFRKLENMTGGLWKAESIEVMDIPVGYQGSGKTPEEAVANLWLELNKQP